MVQEVATAISSASITANSKTINEYNYYYKNKTLNGIHRWYFGINYIVHLVLYNISLNKFNIVNGIHYLLMAEFVAKMS